MPWSLPQLDAGATASPAATAVHAGRATSRGESASGPSSLPEISTLVIAASQHLFLVLGMSAVVAALLAGLIWNFVPPRYRAATVLRVRQREDYILQRQESPASDAAFVRSQERAVTLPHVLHQALQKPEVAGIAGHLPDREVAEWLQGIVQVHFPTSTEVMTISVQHARAEVAQVLVNAVTQAYVAEANHGRRAERERRRAELTKLAEQARRDLQQRWRRLQELAKELGTGNPQTLSVREQIQLESYREYAQRLRQIQLSRNHAEAALLDARAKSNRDVNVPEYELQAAIDGHPSVLAHRQRLVAIEEQIHTFAGFTPHDDAPRLTRLRDDRDYQTQQLRQTISDLRPRLLEEMRHQRKSALQSEVERLQLRLEAFRQEERFLTDMLAQLESQMNFSSGEQSVQLEMMRHDIEREERIADSLWNSLEQLRIEEQAEPRVTLLATADLPVQPNRSRQLRTGVVAAGSGIFAVVFGVGYVEFRSGRIRSPEDIAARCGLHLFGAASYAEAVPLLRRGLAPARRHAASGVHELAAYLSAGEGAAASKLLVTAATEREPRHQLALELAQTLAKCGQRTLLVELSVVAPRLQQFLNVDLQRPGIRDLLCDAGLGDVRLATSVVGLDFMPAGIGGGYPTLASRQRSQRPFGSFESRYDAIVVHAPAVLSNAEMILLTACADAAVLSLTAGTSRSGQVVAGAARLQDAGLPVLGALLHSETGETIEVGGVAPEDDGARGLEQNAELERRLQNDVDEMHRDVQMRRTQQSSKAGSISETEKSSTSPSTQGSSQ